MTDDSEAERPYAYSVEYESDGKPVRWLRWTAEISDFTNYDPKPVVRPLFLSRQPAAQLERRKGERREEINGYRRDGSHNPGRTGADRRQPAAREPEGQWVPKEPKPGLFCGDVAISTDPGYAGWIFVRHVDGVNWTTGAKLTSETWAMLRASEPAEGKSK